MQSDIVTQQQHIPLDTIRLFPILDSLLIDLLRSLSPAAWQLPTVAKLWTVKDIASHLLDGNMRTLSFSRDGHVPETPAGIDSYSKLVAYLNSLNHDWTKATKRLSPQLLTGLLETTGKAYYEHLQSLDPFAEAIFSVAWAGQNSSPNWFHIAREYTEKFIHQQQIRAAVGKQVLFTRELFYPFINTFMMALPHTYRDTPAPTGTIVMVEVLTDIGGTWYIIKEESGWAFTEVPEEKIAASLHIDPTIAWQLFSKSLSPAAVSTQVKISGDTALAGVALHMVSVMA